MKTSGEESKPREGNRPRPGIIVIHQDELIALEVDHVIGQQQIFVRPMSGHLAPIGFYGGSTILSDGEPAIILNLPELTRQFFTSHKGQHVAEELNNQDTLKYLIYQLGDENFATPLIEIREVIEFRTAKPIPHTADFFKGVINIRGEIVGVVDLRERLNIPAGKTPAAQLIFETENGPLAAIVDKVHSVTIINESDLERKPAVSASNNDRAYFLGVGKVEGKLLTWVAAKNSDA